MKLILKKTVILLIVISTLLGVSCARALPEYTVTYVYGDERENTVKTYRFGSLADKEAPEREGYEFVGWCTNKDLTNFYDFANPVKTNTVLYAKWDIDYKELLEKANSKAVSASVKIVVPGFFGSSQGSGVIYKNVGKYWYAFTNDHVLTSQNANPATIYAYDSNGKEYNASLVKKSSEYDLAVIKIHVPGIAPFEVMSVEDRIPGENETLLTVSTPGGQYNTVNLGNASWYGKLNETLASNAESDVDFEVLWISGDAEHGSSGGAVYDTDLDIVGIIYAIATSKENDEKYILAIPASKILEFISDI